VTTKNSAAYRDMQWRRREERVLVDGRWVAVNAEFHGRYTTYNNWHCRCVPCSDDQARNVHLQREDRRRRRVLVDGLQTAVGAEKHNEATYANWGCRCPTCSEAWTSYERFNRATRQ
jgi:hypothetical protein